MTAKRMIQQAAILLVILIAAVHAGASISDRRVTVNGASRRLGDLFMESKVDQKALRYALEYMDRYEDRFTNTRYLTLIDYSLPSDRERLYVFDLKTGKWERHLVAHGRGSGSRYAREFSNRGGSAATSLGLFRTGNTYSGKNGRSLRLQGLSKTNTNALNRAIVFHAAGPVRVGRKKVPYVSREMLNYQNQLGRSLGCPALDPRVSNDVIAKIKNGSVVYAFAD